MHENTLLNFENGDREVPNEDQDELDDFGWELRIIPDDEFDEELEEQEYHEEQEEQEEDDEEEVQDEKEVEEEVGEVEEVKEELPQPVLEIPVLVCTFFSTRILVEKKVQSMVSSISDEHTWAQMEIKKILIQSTNNQMSEHVVSERRTMRTRRRALLKVLQLEDILMRQLAAEEETDVVTPQALVKLAKDQSLENILKDHMIWLAEQIAKLKGEIEELRECRREFEVTLLCSWGVMV